MQKEKKELEVIIRGEIDLSKIPKDIFDAFLVVLKEDIYRWIKENNGGTCQDSI